MKLLFIGSLIDEHTLDEIMLKSRRKASSAPVYFQNMLIKGIEESGVDTKVLSIPTVSTFPSGCLFAWGRRKETLKFGKQVTWIPCINILGIKQFCMSVGCFVEAMLWAIKNRKDKSKVIMNYSVHPAYSKATQRVGRLFGVKTCSIITDLPEYLYKMGKSSGITEKLNNYYSKKMVKCQGGYDMYVCLTEHMPKKMGIEKKPWILMEGFADESNFAGIPDLPKNNKKTVMYAGRLAEDFNIRALLDGFMNTKGDYELWLFGSGDMVDYIKECEKQDNRITYFGKVERKELLEHQKMTHLLISVKSPEEDHANYAFPSKILEYMTSGTAVASTRVGGIPKEYFDYIIPIDSADSEGLAKVISEALDSPTDSIINIGCLAKQYALENKSYTKQSSRIISFISDCL